MSFSSFPESNRNWVIDNLVGIMMISNSRANIDLYVFPIFNIWIYSYFKISSSIISSFRNTKLSIIFHICLANFSRICFSFFFLFLGPHMQHMEVPRLGVECELQLPAYTTATAMPDLSSICNLHHTSQQCQIFNPLSEARYRTWILMGTRWIHFHCATMGIYRMCFFFQPWKNPFLLYMLVLLQPFTLRSFALFKTI